MLDVGKIYKNCAYFRIRKGVPSRSVIKQKVKEDYSYRKFKPK